MNKQRKRSIDDTLSNAAVWAITVLLSCTLPSGWCDEGTDVRGLHYYRKAESGKPKLIDCDVAVYGGTPAGVTAAIQAARAGQKALLLSFNRHVGGVTSGGLTATDVGRKESIGGLAREFYTRIGRIGDFRPSEAESLFLSAESILQEAFDGGHPDLARALAGRARCLRRAGRADEALEPAEAALEIRQRLLGSSHPDIAASELEIAIILSDLGR